MKPIFTNQKQKQTIDLGDPLVHVWAILVNMLDLAYAEFEPYYHFNFRNLITLPIDFQMRLSFRAFGDLDLKNADSHFSFSVMRTLMWKENAN
jgi:hypothetical protein